MSSALKIVFAGTPEFASVSLNALLNSDHNVVAVYTQPDRPAGRGRKLTASAVKQMAEQHQIPLHQPFNLKDMAETATLKSLKPDVLVVVAYGLILPKAILDIPKFGCINVHASLLPKWRGAAPIQRSILSGDEETGVTIMDMDVGLDTGDMYMKYPTPIHDYDNSHSLHDRLAAMGAEALIATLTTIQLGYIEPQAQDDALASYAAKLTKDEAKLDWRRSAVELHRSIRGYNPWPVAHSTLDGENFKIREAHLLEQKALDQRTLNQNTTVTPGTVLAQDKTGIQVATGDAVILLTNVQLPGKRPMAAHEFNNAHNIVGKILGTSD